MQELKLSRRLFLKSSSGAAAAIGGVGAASAKSAAPAARPVGQTTTTLDYPKHSLGKTVGLPLDKAVAFNYPDGDSPCMALRMGSPVPGGVGPNGDIVAFSSLCTHMGCQVAYDAGTRTFKCGCHFSIFDPENGGQMVCGQATEDLPKVMLEYDPKTDTVTAVGIDGLIYGRQANML